MKTGDGSSCLTLKTSRKGSLLLLSLNPRLVKYVESSTSFHLISALAETMCYPWMIILSLKDREMENRGMPRWLSCNPIYMPGPRHTNLRICLTRLTLLKQISPQKPIKTFSKGHHCWAISYKETRARHFLALYEKMCSIYSQSTFHCLDECLALTPIIISSVSFGGSLISCLIWSLSCNVFKWG